MCVSASHIRVDLLMNTGSILFMVGVAVFSWGDKVTFRVYFQTAEKISTEKGKSRRPYLESNLS